MKSFSLRARVEGHLARAIMALPRSLLVRLAGKPIVRGDDVLDTQVQLAIALHRLTGKKQPHQQSVAVARAEFEGSAILLAPSSAPLASIDDLTLAGPAGPLPARIYRPRGVASPAPALVYFHGGGFVLGSLDTSDGQCRALAAGASCVVISVDYRLAPEHRFPAAVEDAIAAFRQVGAEASRLGIDAARLAVGGDSAGGNLSAVVSQATRADAVRPCLQLLMYPATDMTLSSPSIRALASGFLLEKTSIEWFVDHYLPAGQDRLDPRASPLFAASFAELPPAFLATAGFDPIRDDGEAYATKLAKAGVPVEHRNYGALVHGFLNLAGSIDAARAPLDEAIEALRHAFAAPRAAEDAPVREGAQHRA